MFALYLSIVLLYIVYEIYPSGFVDSAIGICAILIIFLNISKASRMYRWAGLCFLSLGFFFYFLSVPGEVPLLSLFGSLTNLLALLFVLPYMSTIISVGKYDRALSQMISRPPKPTAVRLYRRTSLMAYILTLFLNVATVPVVVAAAKDKLHGLKDQLIQRFFAHSMLRAYAFVLLWSPTEILVASMVDLTGQSYLTLLPTLFAISILFMSVDWWLHGRGLRTVDIDVESDPNVSSQVLRKKLLQLVGAVLAFMTSVLILNDFIPQSFLFTVTILIPVFTFLWAVFIRKGKRFRSLSTWYLIGNTTQLHGLFFLFLSAGFFVEVFPHTFLFDLMDALFVHTYENYSLILYYLMVGLFIFGFALIGFHPLISISILAPLLTGAIEQHPYGVSILLIGIGLSTVMIGPFNITPTILAMQLRANPYVIIQKNLVFALVYLLFIVTTAYVLSLLM